MKNSDFLIYGDYGVSSLSVHHSYMMLKNFGINETRIKIINSHFIKEYSWMKTSALLIMPGGADTFYAKNLNGIGNTIIKNYVENGGSYLGFCAGAYYACAHIEFAKNTEIEQIGSRELSFYPGKMVGPILSSYSYTDKSGFKAADIKWLTSQKNLHLFYNGGGAFWESRNCQNTKVLAEYNLSNSENLPAIISTKIGNGSVILSGVHLEIDPGVLNEYEYSEESLNLLRLSNPGRIEFIRDILKMLLN